MQKLIFLIFIVAFTPAIMMSQTNNLNVNTAFPGSDNFRKSPKETVALFLKEVRSGLHPEKAGEYMADTVLAHQVNSENPVTVSRTPANYTAHVNEFLSLFGKYEFQVTELLADGDKVYARWIQKGRHLSDIDAYKATRLPLVEYTSAVYRVEGGKIVEYWLQSDRLGMEAQLKNNAAAVAGLDNFKE